jgi:hypothetical protein
MIYIYTYKTIISSQEYFLERMRSHHENKIEAKKNLCLSKAVTRTKGEVPWPVETRITEIYRAPGKGS